MQWVKGKLKGIEKGGDKGHLYREGRQTFPSEPDLIGVSSVEERQASFLKVKME